MIATQKYIRKPLYVDAVRLTRENFDEIAAWCQGEILQEEAPSRKRYIKIRVHNPKNARQTKAFVGDWLLYTERGYKVYTNKAFQSAFDMSQEEIVPGVTAAEAVEQIQNPAVMSTTPAVDDQFKSVPVEESETTPQGESIETVPATPEAIAEAVRENEQAIEDEIVAAEGKRVLSMEEQSQMDQEEIRELLKTGDVILAQDLAA